MATNKKQTATNWLKEQFELQGFFGIIKTKEDKIFINSLFDKAKQMEREQMIELVQQLKDYTRESRNILGHDEREASEFVDIFYNNIYGKES